MVGYRARSADRSTKDAHIIAPRDLSGVFWREAAAQHRRDQLHPLRVVLQTAGSDLLVGADGNMLYGDDINHFFQAVDIFFEAREEVPDADCTARLGNRPRVVAADLPSVSGVGTHRRRTRKRGVRQE